MLELSISLRNHYSSTNEIGSFYDPLYRDTSVILMYHNDYYDKYAYDYHFSEYSKGKILY